MNLQELNLTSTDFEMILSGLEALPNRNMAGELMGDLFISMLSKDDPESKAKAEYDRQNRELSNKRKRAEMQEEVDLLKAKLIQLKRILQQEGALNETISIINRNF